MLKRTPLFETHVGLGARMLEFGGWDMPIQYSSILDEHKAVRTAAGIFDIAHMGEVFVRGPEAEAFLNATLTNDARKLMPGQGQYTLMCNLEGGVLDDLFAYRLAADEFLLIINASCIEADVQWLTRRLAAFPPREQVKLDDASGRLSAVAIQGPQVPAFIDNVLAESTAGSAAPAPRPSELKRNRIGMLSLEGDTIWIARTGYTGEDGFEIVAPNNRIRSIWEGVLKAGARHGVKPCGLGARDTLRTEMCFPLYGHELTTEVTPLEAGLDVFVALDKGDFCGRDPMVARKQEGMNQRLAAFRMADRATPPPRPHYTVWSAGTDGTRLGECTSGTLSPSLGVGIGMAYLPPSAAEPGSSLQVEIRGRRYPAEIVKKPLYRRPTPPKAI